MAFRRLNPYDMEQTQLESLAKEQAPRFGLDTMMTSAECIKWLEVSDVYTLHLIDSDLFFYIQDLQTDIYYMTRDFSERKDADKAGITPLDLQEWIELLRGSAVPVARSPFRKTALTSPDWYSKRHILPHSAFDV